MALSVHLLVFLLFLQQYQCFRHGFPPDLLHMDYENIGKPKILSVDEESPVIRDRRDVLSSLDFSEMSRNFTTKVSTNDKGQQIS